MQIDVSDAVLELSHYFDQLTHAQLRKAISKALNDSIKQGRTIVKRGITDVYNIRSSYLANKNLPIKRSSSSKLVSSLAISNRPVPIGKFKGVSQVLGRGRKRGGVTVAIKKGQRKKIKGAFFKKTARRGESVLHRAYLNNNSGYKNGEFQYRNKRIHQGSDVPIASMFTVSPFTAAVNKSTIDRAGGKVQEAFKSRLEYHISAIIAKSN